MPLRVHQLGELGRNGDTFHPLHEIDLLAKGIRRSAAPE